MRKDVEKKAINAIAWVVLMFASIAFVALCVGIIRWGFGL